MKEKLVKVLTEKEINELIIGLMVIVGESLIEIAEDENSFNQVKAKTINVFEAIEEKTYLNNYTLLETFNIVTNYLLDKQKSFEDDPN